MASPVLRRALTFVLAMVSLVGWAPVRATSPALDIAGLQADARLLEQTYEALHPGLYRYNTPAQMRERFAQLRRELAADPSLPTAYVAFARLAASIRCGHTYPNYWNQPKATTEVLFSGANRVPFQFRWVDRRMIVTASALESLPRGTEVLTIDGQSSARVLQALLPLVSADGHNDAKRVDLLNVLGRDRYEAFDVLYPLVFPVRDGQFRLRIRRPGEATVATVQLAAATDAQRAASLPTQAADDPAWTVRFLDEGKAVLTMPSWVMYKSKRDWHAWLDEIFRSLNDRHVRLLVIDLRDNGGGSDVGDDILAHLTRDPRSFPGYRDLLRYRSVPQALRPYLDTWDNAFFDWGDRAQPFDARFYRRAATNDTETAETPRAPFFGGEVKVLVGPTNSSATFEFAVRVRHSRLATLVGQTTGGNLRGINGGAFFFLTLPHSGVELDVPLVGQFPLEPQPDAGLEPDVPVPVTIDDIAAQRDRAMEVALGEAQH
ncbi:S41 family peptidase [Luteibacter sp. UNCMF366Tsu5.1]|uniref:S41 family peptidase n=1 Tax=Luteibacter sp. UNCMF366Tsu5.1 TaxID=1502758 RepID=UPI000908D8EA|nr:S41 family peptidase [Luteibacter sp. UNCMF366Tsu5.1]SFW23763.1 Peptidase family S41 [Luteibacter sp. UNCMF366Tsu5.1]